MPDGTYWLVVLGTGSFGLGHRTWRAGAHEVDAETAREALDWKARYAPEVRWLAVLDEEPDLLSDPLSGTLDPEDLRAGFQSGVRFKTPPASAPLPEPTPEDPEPPPTLFACQWCPASFPSSARLGRHVRKQHVPHYEEEEQRLRAEFQAEQEARVAERRGQDAAPGEGRPEERPLESTPTPTIPLTAADHLDRLTGGL